MEFTYKTGMFASPELVRNIIGDSLKDFGLEFTPDRETVIRSEPLRVEDIKQGFLFKRTYHQWTYKCVAVIYLYGDFESGEYKILIKTPIENTFPEKDAFLLNFESRMQNLNKSIEVRFSKTTELDNYTKDNLPDYRYIF